MATAAPDRTDVFLDALALIQCRITGDVAATAAILSACDQRAVASVLADMAASLLIELDDSPGRVLDQVGYRRPGGWLSGLASP
ncbi:MAG: hypothetical protein M3Y33_09190 [Actinomycetota bacterium]|nr:hypothetical protein [Actinomycetota bacterium]